MFMLTKELFLPIYEHLPLLNYVTLVLVRNKELLVLILFWLGVTMVATLNGIVFMLTLLFLLSFQAVFQIL